MREYWQFFEYHWRFLCFGLLIAIVSNFGQTYFIGLFSESIRTEFNLSHGDFGRLFSCATLLSGILLLLYGGIIDTIDLRWLTLGSAISMIIACQMIAFAPSVWGLFLALFALRVTGQGAMGQIAMTAMSRYFDQGRGKALSIAGMGFPLGEAVFPWIMVMLLMWGGWRLTWMITGLILLILFVPLLLWLLKGHSQRHAAFIQKYDMLQNGKQAELGFAHHWTRREVLQDKRFYMLLPGILAPATILTGTFFHQVHLSETKGWSLSWLAICFIGFAVANILGGFFFGAKVDKYSALKMMGWYLPLLGMGLIVLALFDSPWVAMWYMVFSGLAVGGSRTIVSALWAELYGVLHLGQIRALISSIFILSTSMVPFGVGKLLDAGVTFDAIILVSCVYIVISIALTQWVKSQTEKRSEP